MSMLPTPPITIKRFTSQEDLNGDDFTFEEMHDDVIYQVTYRKVYNRQEQLQQQLQQQQYQESLSNSGNGGSLSQSLPNGLVYSKIKIKQIKFGTVERLVDAFTNEMGELDSNVTCTFLATYRSFSNTKEVLGILYNKYAKIFPVSLDMTEDIRIAYVKSFRSIITTWLDSYSEDFDVPPTYDNLVSIEDFVLEHVPDNREILTYLHEKLKIFLNNKKLKDQQMQRQIEIEKQEKFEQIVKSESETQLKVKKLYNSKSEIDLANIKIAITDDRQRKYVKQPAPPPPPPPSAPHSSSTTTSSSSLGTSAHHAVKAHYQRSLSNTSNHRSNILLDNDDLSSSTAISQSQLAAQKAIALNHQKLMFKHINGDLNENFKCILNLNIKFKDIDEQFFAEQLTYIDKEMFQKVLPYHCLGAVWSTRKKLQNENFESINSFIEQFNILTFIVQGTVLENPHDARITSYKRAKKVEKWIRIALHLRNLKNFSSLNAIVQGLDTQCVGRLEKVWNDVSTDYKNQFNELIELFSQDNNQKQFRETLMKQLLTVTKRPLKSLYNLFRFPLVLFNPITKKEMQEYERIFKAEMTDSTTTSGSTSSNNLKFNNLLEGTAKYANINIGINATLSKKEKEKLIKQRNNSNDPIGTIPFLGTFLRDLEYIHAQNPTRNDNGLINFVKKRKEFEIIAQIKLLQRAAQFYKIEEDVNFRKWMSTLPSYNEETNYEYSYLLEPRVIERDQSTSSSSRLHLKKPSFSYSTDSLNSGGGESRSHAIAIGVQKQLNRQHSRNSSNTSSDIHLSNSVGSSSLNGLSYLDNGANGTSSSVIGGASTSGVGGVVSNLICSTVNSFHSSSCSPSTNSVPAAATTNSSIASGGGASAPSAASKIPVKVNIPHLNDTIAYKTIYVKDSDRCKEVKRLILNKFLADNEKVENYSLIQVFNDGENKDLLISDTCNVFYAAKQVKDMQFILKLKEPQVNIQLNGNPYPSHSNHHHHHHHHRNASDSKFFTVSTPKPVSSKPPLNTTSATISQNNNKNNANLPPQAPDSQHKRRASWDLFRNILP